MSYPWIYRSAAEQAWGTGTATNQMHVLTTYPLCVMMLTFPVTCSFHFLFFFRSTDNK